MNEGGIEVKFYTIKLPRFLGGMVKVLIGMFGKKE
ncbi:Stage V sporulation protein family protein [Seinonella peptonophila]|uniref:Stage V sporulation protein family protein n=1 Tax=Seinonella peptonophila TaxID=112248 RepID=A0A1M4UV71_9BACL|nr:Stage V sporulation protein family protein [Seinonella peptonophila]